MKEPHSKCYFHALKYLSRYPKTEKELRAYLLQKWYSEHDTDRAMEHLKFKKYVDDAQFVELYVQSEAIRKGKPLYAVTQKLIQKGVDPSLIDTFADAHQEEKPLYAVTQKLIQKGVDPSLIDTFADAHQEDIQYGTHEKIRKEIAQYKRKWVDGFEFIQKIMRKGYKLDDIKKVIYEDKE